MKSEANIQYVSCSKVLIVHHPPSPKQQEQLPSSLSLPRDHTQPLSTEPPEL